MATNTPIEEAEAEDETQNLIDQNPVIIIPEETNDEEEIKKSSYLPREILLDILSRLPLDSVLRYQIVSKSWNAVISELRFSRVHHCKNFRHHFLWQSYVSGQRRDESDDYSDFKIDHEAWKSMLPPSENQRIWKSASLVFWVEPRTGKNCFLMGAQRLELPSSERVGSAPRWRPRFVPQSRFPEVAELAKPSKTVLIRGVLRVEMLSPDTFYSAHLVFQLADSDDPTILFILDACRGESGKGKLAVSREDGWMEVEIGELSVTKEDNIDIEAVVLLQAKHYKMDSLIVEGIEFRPSGTLMPPTVSTEN